MSQTRLGGLWLCRWTLLRIPSAGILPDAT